MFGGSTSPPRHLKSQTKTPLEKLDISMPHGDGVHGHRARDPNTDSLGQWLHYRQQSTANADAASKQYEQEVRAGRLLAIHDKSIERRHLREVIQAKLHEKVEHYVQLLEERREKLRQLMATEEEAFVRETVENAQKGDENKLADMKRRSQALKEAKEAERLELVKQKRIQQYSLRCVELRPFLSRKLTEESKMCQLQQIRDNEARRQAEKEIGFMFDDLLRKQDEAFLEREVQEAIIKYNRCKKDMDILTMQIRAKKLMNQQSDAMERANAIEAKRIRDIQDEEDREAMRRNMDRRRQDAADLQTQIDIQKQFAAQRKKEETALDNAFAKLAALELQREQAKIVDNKDQMRREVEIYKHHLLHLKQQRIVDEQVLAQVIAEYRDAATRKSDAAHCKFQAGRRSLHERVMAERAAQVAHNKQKLEKELEFKRAENEMMSEIFETNRRLQNEADRIRRMEIMQYRADLKKQIEYNYALKQSELEAVEKRLQQGMEEEKRLEEMLKEIIGANISTSMEHPFRRVVGAYDCKCKE